MKNTANALTLESLENAINEVTSTPNTTPVIDLPAKKHNTTPLIRLPRVGESIKLVKCEKGMESTQFEATITDQFLCESVGEEYIVYSYQTVGQTGKKRNHELGIPKKAFYVKEYTSIEYKEDKNGNIKETGNQFFYSVDRKAKRLFADRVNGRGIHCNQFYSFE